MKKTEFKILILILFLLIGMIAGMPAFLTAVEDASLKGKTKSYETETVNLTPDDTSLKQKLQEITAVYSGHRVAVESGGTHTETELIEEVERLFELIFLKEENSDIIKFSAHLFLAPSLDYQHLYSFWDCYAADENGAEYHLLLDDTTGKILSFVCPNYYTGIYTKEDMKSFWDKMEKYYGFPLDGVGITHLYNQELLFFNYDIMEKEYMKNSISFVK